MTRSRLDALRLVLLTCATVGLATAAGACSSREHLRDDYGEHVRLFQSKQRVYLQATVGGPSGLDSEEAAAIHKGYRTSLGGKAAAPATGSNRVLMLGDEPNGGSK